MGLVFSIFAIIERRVTNSSAGSASIPMKYYAVVATAMTLSRGFTNISLMYLNYPTQVDIIGEGRVDMLVGWV